MKESSVLWLTVLEVDSPQAGPWPFAASMGPRATLAHGIVQKGRGSCGCHSPSSCSLRQAGQVTQPAGSLLHEPCNKKGNGPAQRTERTEGFRVAPRPSPRPTPLQRQAHFTENNLDSGNRCTRDGEQVEPGYHFLYVFEKQRDR